MGTYGQVSIASTDSLYCAGKAEMVLTTFHRVDSLMSNWTTTSEVARINREGAASPRGVQNIHPEVVTVLAEAIAVWESSDGAFDITVEPLVRAWGFLGDKPRVPSAQEIEAAFELVGMDALEFDPSDRSLHYGREGMKIDLGGIAKGYAVDAAADSLRAHGVSNFLVDISGNIYARGAPEGQDAWRIGIKEPGRRAALMGRIFVTNTAVATSGAYEQFVDDNGEEYGHILDPRTGKPAAGLLSATVLSPSAMAADAWATALFVLGVDEAKRIAKARDDLHVILVERGMNNVDIAWVEEPLKDTLVLNRDVAKYFKIEIF
jgi:thiamine biosynthesis lipoprotein